MPPIALPSPRMLYWPATKMNVNAGLRIEGQNLDGTNAFFYSITDKHQLHFYILYHDMNSVKYKFLIMYHKVTQKVKNLLFYHSDMTFFYNKVYSY